MVKWLTKYINAFWDLMLEMAPYLMLGLFFAAVLHIYFPKSLVQKWLGKPGLGSNFRAAAAGVPLPLCSCGVIPVGVSFYKNGASKGSTSSFLISTPQTGVDSILATYSLMGPAFAFLRVGISFITGLFGGFLEDKLGKPSNDNTLETNLTEASEVKTKDLPFLQKWAKALKYAFVDFLKDIAKWLIIGVAIAALLELLIPANFFGEFTANPWLQMLLILPFSIPLYVCATGSIPIAATLIMKGLSPGAALVFLMAGPATNAATISVLKKVMGTRSLWIYLSAIIMGSIFFGWVLNTFLPAHWFEITNHTNHQHGTPQYLSWISAISLSMLLIYVLIPKRKKTNSDIKNNNKMADLKIDVDGMSCGHCENNVEQHLTALEGIEEVKADHNKSQVYLTGSKFDLSAIKQTIEQLGYKFKD